MRAKLVMDGHTDVGGSPLVMHHERLADPLDGFVRKIREISGRRKKSDADHMEIARLEFLGALYLDDDPEGNYSPSCLTGCGGPGLPAWNIIRCLQDGGKRHKRGLDVIRGVHPLRQAASLSYFGDKVRDPEKLWKSGKFSLRKTVGVSRARVMRTRPIFTDWRCELDVEVDPIVWDMDALSNVWADAGKYAGIGEMRPVYGRFVATVEVES